VAPPSFTTSEPGPRLDTWTASDGYRAHYRAYLPSGAPRANLVCLHGIQSHGGWYEYSCSRLCAAGYGVYFLDRRGSGLNPDARGDTPSAVRVLDDIREFIEQQKLDTGATPLVLMGCSWGGKQAAAFCQRHPGVVEALAMLYPGIAARVGPPFGERIRILLARLVNPTRRFAIPLTDPKLFTSALRWQEFIDEDRLALRDATARFLMASVILDLRLRRVRKRLKLATLLMLAGRDQIIDNDRTRRRVRRLCRGDQQVIVYPYAQHTLEFEPNRDEFIGDLLRWLEYIDAEIRWKRSQKC
jgi:alpha-beta hydrolase superfamily lysophospholipase